MPSSRGMERCLLWEGGGWVQPSNELGISGDHSSESQYFGVFILHLSHDRYWFLPLLLMAFPQHLGRVVILGEAETIFNFSRWMALSGDLRPIQETVSPGESCRRSLFTGPPSLKATKVSPEPSEITLRLACAPLTTLGSDITVPNDGPKRWSSDSWLDMWDWFQHLASRYVRILQLLYLRHVFHRVPDREFSVR